MTLNHLSPVGCGCRIYWLHLCRGVLPPPTMSVLNITQNHLSPVGWGCRIHRLHLCRGVRPPLHSNECPKYDTKQSDGEAPVILELWGMRSTLSLPLLPSLLLSGVIDPDRVLSMRQIELNYVLMLNWIARNSSISIFKQCTYVKLNCLK